MRYFIIALVFLTGCGILGSQQEKSRRVISDTLVVSAASIGQDKFDNDSDTLRASVYGNIGFDPNTYDSLFVNVLGKNEYHVVDIEPREFTVLRKRNMVYEIVMDDSLYFYIKL